MKRSVLLLGFALVSGSADTDELTLELGPGFEYSRGYNGYFLQY